MDLPDNIEKIEVKIRLLALKMSRLEKENAVLKNENKNLLQEELTIRHKKVDLLEDKLENTLRKLDTRQGKKPENSDKFKQTITQYIDEIDKCIEWLQKY